MILGDNFLYGSMLSPLIKESFLNPKGANIYLYPSKNTSAYGVVELGKNGSIKKIIEKPKEKNEWEVGKERLDAQDYEKWVLHKLNS